MPVYRLTPLEKTAASPQWRASLMHPYCLWISAADESEARRQVARATLPPGEAETQAPWRNADLVACEYDADKSVAAGIICVRRQPLSARAA